MDDNMIIKALECCNDGACEYCPIVGDNCIQRSRDEAVNLINRQKAEIERLTTIMLKKEDTMQLLNQEQQNTDDELQKAKAEIERLKERNDELNALNKIASIEAIKEFWSKLKEISSHIVDKDLKVINYVEISDGDNLVKEMVGETND